MMQRIPAAATAALERKYTLYPLSSPNLLKSMLLNWGRRISGR